MLAALRNRLTFANVMSVVALFVGLGGTSVAAVTLKRNAVLSKHIKDGQIQGSDVKDASLLAGDFADGQLPRGPAGDRGPQGEQGPEGDRGPQGEPGVSGSPDAPNEVLAKLTQVDGGGSGLDADLLDGVEVSDLQRRGTQTVCSSFNKVAGIAENGNVDCAADRTEPTGLAGGGLQGTYPNPGVRTNSIGSGQLKSSDQEITAQPYWVGGCSGACWSGPPFENGWGNESTAHRATFRKDLIGIVHLAGRVRGGTVSNGASGTIFTLPSSHRPESSGPLSFPVVSSDGFGQVRIVSTGTGTYQVQAWTPSSNNWISLDGISFPSATY